MPDWVTPQVLAALIGLTTAGVGLLSAWARKRWRTSRLLESVMMERVLEKVGVIYQKLSEIESAGASRAVVLVATNGGGIASTGQPMYGSAIYEIHRREIDSAQETWQKVPLDPPYVETLRRLVTEKILDIRTEKLPEGSLLRALYERDGVKSSMVLLLHSEPGGLYYLSVNFKQDLPDGAAPTIRRSIIRCAAVIRACLKHHEEVRVRGRQHRSGVE